MAKYYSDEKNAQILVALLKAHGIKKIIASPGTTNMALVVSLRHDPFFEIYSSVDERSAAYLACGLAAESGEPVVISCTGATASRNYLSGLTEAYYRKLPILAITSTQALSKVGHHVAQVIDRSSIQKDVAKHSIALPIVKDDNDLWDCEVKVNEAILELFRNGGGPVHINLPTTYSTTYSAKELPSVKVINRITIEDNFPELPKGKVAIFVGSHGIWDKNQINAIDKFCSLNNSVVFCDHTSGYKGKYRVLISLLGSQHLLDKSSFTPDVLIHIGEISGDYSGLSLGGKQIWRVSKDGEIRDTFSKLRYVFEMSESIFFTNYSNNNIKPKDDSYLKLCKEQLLSLNSDFPDVPFSNIWFASKMAHKLPENSCIHFAILNSLRSWNLFEIPQTVNSSSNVGGFGIDGCVSSLVGASFNNPNKIYFGVIGDLAFFYDMNVIGNRHLSNNIRILLVNNGKGTEFRQFNHKAAQFEDAADEFIAAGGHFGNKSKNLVKNYVTDLGFEYFSATNKNEFEKVYDKFLSPKMNNKPMVFEVFTNNEDESDALQKSMNIVSNVKGKAKDMAKQVLGKKGIGFLKNVIKK